MLAILFPHMYEDIEYLLPSADGEDASNDDSSSVDFGGSSRDVAARRQGRNVNAIAGPSRIS
jgi:E3 ubiquitin-protein ligase SHPRH